MSSSFDPTDPRSLARRAETYALAFDEAGSTLAVQERAAAELRGRGASMVATAAVATSLFGGPALGHLHTGPALYAAVGAFIGVCFCALALMWPRRLLDGSEPGQVIAQYAEPRRVPLSLVHRDLALERSESIARNRRTLTQMTGLSRAALLLLAVEIVAWVVNYAIGV